MCTPFPGFKKITGQDQIIVHGDCVSRCSSSDLITYSYSVYMCFNLNNASWIPISLDNSYFKGKIILLFILIDHFNFF